jgi:transposase
LIRDTCCLVRDRGCGVGNHAVLRPSFPLFRAWRAGTQVSMRPSPWPEPAPEVAAAIAAMYQGRGKRGGRRELPLPVAVRDELGELFGDAEFAAAFGVVGRPGWSPGRLMLVTVLQRAENLTDRQAAEAVRRDLSWKYAMGLGLADEGFDPSVLSEFRGRVVEYGLAERALDLLLARLVEAGLVKAGGAQRTNSTHVISAVRDLNRLELAGECHRGRCCAGVPTW